MEHIIKIFLAIITLLISMCKQTNAQFITSGTIEYVKTTNMHLTMKVEYKEEFEQGGFMEQMLKMIPKNATKIYTMTFDKNKSYFSYTKDGPEKMPNFGGKDPASENIVFKNFDNNTYEAQKEVFDEILLIKDSIPRYKWKIHDELRQIAGFNCRKATTVVNDSMVVVAFYTEEIMVNSGPESFGGLPGMILGLAVPRLYSTWFAKSVTAGTYDEKMIKSFSKKAKNVTIKSQNDFIRDKLKEWGKFGEQIIYKIMI